ncbi:hypothetical protein SCP_0306130 [Sparassis crispa]|uniref:Uncharacterized protein n=1 Tax=Sparassis crispa TaxID=139825 RepID=A0A401GFE6_9APHY|nr:hypothetical protein SCP_0306130 [Sparassis crispa]GBE80892.1 hypothetical protein SCP_0306130 [Sparassis crispa]
MSVLSSQTTSYASINAVEPSSRTRSIGAGMRTLGVVSTGESLSTSREVDAAVDHADDHADNVDSASHSVSLSEEHATGTSESGLVTALSRSAFH